MSSAHFLMDDRDLDDAELWDVIDSAAAARSRRIALSIKNSSPASHPSIAPAKLFQSAKSYLDSAEAESRVPSDGEVVQEDRWPLARPQKIARFVEPAASGDHNRMLVFRHPSRTPVVSSPSPSYPSPVPGKFSAKEVSPIIESPNTNCWRGDEKENSTHCLSGGFPSVSMFKQYQNAAMAGCGAKAPVEERPPKVIDGVSGGASVAVTSGKIVGHAKAAVVFGLWSSISGALVNIVYFFIR
ncbi:hypothetical protein KSP39_PZI021765 [Platanthera zijinensis]|uniref:Uncharacterized protein n=1 Tax=Platanthera zijinensis TaxID=2320716 RepID=A0AAP0AXT0_9ASPA